MVIDGLVATQEVEVNPKRAVIVSCEGGVEGSSGM
jgi:hypothetical protein